MSAPERIWMQPDGVGPWFIKPVQQSTEYLRADLVAADAARLAAVRAFIAGQTRHNCALVRTLREMLE